MSDSLLTPDLLTIPGQKFAVVSFVGPDQPQKTDKLGMRISGVFDSTEEATAWIRRLHAIDNRFDRFVVELYNWIEIPPQYDRIENTIYDNPTLDQIMKGYLDNQKARREVFEQRRVEFLQRPDVNELANKTGLTTEAIVKMIDEDPEEVKRLMKEHNVKTSGDASGIEMPETTDSDPLGLRK